MQEQEGAGTPLVRIVVADDDEMLTTLWSPWLAKFCPAEVVGTASSAADVVRAVSAATPDILVIDQGITGAGAVVLREVRTRWPELYIVVVSGALDPDAARLAGADVWLSKGEGPRAIGDAVSAYLGR